MIDVHTHILPGIDDGPVDMAASVDLALALVDAGTEVVVATPHVRDDYPTEPATIEYCVARLSVEIAERDLPLRVVPGAEVAMDRLPRIDDDDLRRLTLGANGRHLLVEPPFSAWPLGASQTLFDLAIAGYVPVIAHPERNAAIQADPGLLRPYVEAGALVQITAGSLLGTFGKEAKTASVQLVNAGLVHLVASDAHAAGGRGLGLRDAAASVVDAALARWLTDDVPRAILTGGAVPPRPASNKMQRWWWRRG